MSTDRPIVTVLMSVYNGERFLAEALDSILAQSFRQFEFLIINDGSTDGSGEILDRYAAEDPRIRVLHQANQGLIAALNRGVEEATAPLLARMDADDVALPDRLGAQVARFEKQDGLGLLGGHIRIIDESGMLDTGRVIRFPVGEQEVSETLYYGSPVAHPAAMMRVELIRQIGGYRTFFKHSEDYDLWLRLSERALIDNLDQVVLHYRQHGENVSMKHREAQIVGTYLAQAAWMMRLAGGDDPVPSWPGISRDLLFAVPLPADQKKRLLTRWTLAMIDSLPPGHLAEGRALIAALARLPGTDSAEDRSDLARMHGKMSRNAYHARSWPGALVHAAACVRYDPRRAARELIRLSWKLSSAARLKRART